MKRLLLLSFALLATATPTLAATEKPVALAECLAKSGAVMWSAWWCPYCLKQLQMFDSAFTREDMANQEKLAAQFPFVVECALPTSGNSNGQCPKDMRGVPTWGFKDGTRLSGLQPLEVLSAKTACTLPEKSR